MKQLLTYFGLACLISWTIWLPLYGHVLGMTHLPALPFQHAIGGFGPLIAAFITTWIFSKKEGVKTFVATFFKIKPLIYFAVALVSPFILAFIALLFSYGFDKIPGYLPGILSTKEFPQYNILLLFVYNVVFFGFGEEAGWRGFALPRIQNRMNALMSSIVLTVFWALWHIPLFFYRPGYTTMDTAGIFGWIFSLLTGSILLTWLYNSSRASILICAVFHATVDMAFTADIGKNAVNYMGILITVWGILTILVFRPRNLAVIDRKKDV